MLGYPATALVTKRIVPLHASLPATQYTVPPANVVPRQLIAGGATTATLFAMLLLALQELQTGLRMQPS